MSVWGSSNTRRASARVYLLDAKPARCRQVLCFDRPPSQRDDAYIRHHLQQDYWQAYHE